MQYTVILLKNENKQEAEIQEQSRFIKSLLEALEIPVDWDPDEPLSFEKKINLQKVLNTYNIYVIDDMNGGIKIFVDKELIGEWFKCKYTMKEDLKQIDRKKRLYLEMSVKFWSAF